LSGLEETLIEALREAEVEHAMLKARRCSMPKLGRRQPMKAITLIVRQTEIGKLFPNGARLLLEVTASIAHAIEVFDRKIADRSDSFPVKGYRSLFEMVYHPYEKRFYRQVAVQARTRLNQFLNVRENPSDPLPDEATVILIPEGGCSTDWEEPVR